MTARKLSPYDQHWADWQARHHHVRAHDAAPEERRSTHPAPEERRFGRLDDEELATSVPAKEAPKHTEKKKST